VSLVTSLGSCGPIYVGIQTSADSVYILASESEDDDEVVAYSESSGRTIELE